MSLSQGPFLPYYDRSTASDDWRRESERFGMERDRLERLARCGPGYVVDDMPVPTEFPPPGVSYEEFWASTVAMKDREWPEWWGNWKRRNGL